MEPFSINMTKIICVIKEKIHINSTYYMTSIHGDQLFILWQQTEKSTHMNLMAGTFSQSNFVPE